MKQKIKIYIQKIIIQTDAKSMLCIAVYRYFRTGLYFLNKFPQNMMNKNKDCEITKSCLKLNIKLVF